MPSSSFGVARTLSAALLIGASACASSGTRQAANGPRPLTEREQTLAHWQQLRDSMTAQAIADEEGPRVRLRANYDSYSGSRRLRGSFTLEDDAYILIGQLDATGRLSVIFPETPDDDGFVRGGKTYETAERFAGFDDEYFSRASRTGMFRTVAAERDSYDRGAGYLFIVASWRPMRLDRISDGAKFATYELDESELITDPRPAIGELAALIAGDNREAYTLEFAQYFRSMPLSGGTFASAFSSGCGSFLGYSSYSPYSLSYSFYNGYGRSFYGGGCGYRSRYAYGYNYFFPGVVTVTPTPTPTPTPPNGLRPITPPGLPRVPPTSPHPRVPMERGSNGDTRVAQPIRPTITADAAARPHAEGMGPRSYRERGLMTTDDGVAQRPRASTLSPRAFDQPSISDMVGRRRVDAGSERVTQSRYDRPRNVRENVGQPGEYRPGVRPSNSDAGMGSSRETARQAREVGHTYTPSYTPAHAPSETRETRRYDPPSRTESPRMSPPESPRTEQPRAEPTRTATPVERPSAPRGEGGAKPTPNP